MLSLGGLEVSEKQEWAATVTVTPGIGMLLKSYYVV